MSPQALLIVVVGLAGGVGQKNAADDQKELQGTWAVDSLESNGKLISPDTTDKLKVIIDGKKLIFKGQSSDEEMTFRLAPTKKPREIDLISTDKKVGTLEGIYSLEGDKLTICYGRKEKDRPQEFVTKSGDRRVLMVLSREKR